MHIAVYIHVRVYQCIYKTEVPKVCTLVPSYAPVTMSIFNMTISIDKYRERAAPVLAESESMVDAGISNAPICVC